MGDATQHTQEPQALDAAARKGQVSRASHLFMLLCSALCAAFLIWAAVGELDIVSMADGEVAPSTKVKRVEHLEGGIVRQILVREGEAVRMGQELIILEETQQGSSVEELAVRIESLRADVARLTAEAEGTELVFPEDLEQTQPELVEQAKRLYNVRQQRLAGDLAAQREEIAQLTSDISKISVRLQNSQKSLELLNKEMAISEDLLKDQLTTELQHIKLQRELTSLQSRIAEDRQTLVRARSSLKEGQQKLANINRAFQEEARDDLKRAQRELDEFVQRRRKFTDTLSRTVIRSPVAGLVKSMNVVAPGEVVRPGETIMNIVPSEDRLIIEARLPIQDIGYVAVGQTAVVKLASRDARRFGNLAGQVASISPDTLTTEQGHPFYAVRVETDNGYFEKAGNRYQLYPGMLVQVYIHTGKRTVLEYLFSPFIDSLGTALHER